MQSCTWVQSAATLGGKNVAHVQAHEVVDARAHEVDAGAAPLCCVGGERAVEVEQQDGAGVIGAVLVQEPAAAARAARCGRALGSPAPAAGEGHRVGLLLRLLLLAWPRACRSMHALFAEYLAWLYLIAGRGA